MTQTAYQKCIAPDCGAQFPVSQVLVTCPACAQQGKTSLLDIKYNWDQLPVPDALSFFDQRVKAGDGLDSSGVWRFRELLPFYGSEQNIVTVGEGKTILQRADLLAEQIGSKPGNLFLQYEGLNPSGSFKDNGMTAAFTHARMVGATKAACASTGNTSASLALFASQALMKAIVFIGSGKIAYGKLSQALGYGAKTLQIEGDFDACLRRVRQIVEQEKQLGIYLMNSLNPFRLEGQKTIMYRILEALRWQVPDWIVVPGGNLGNSSSFGKAFLELKELGLIKKVPRLAIIQAAGANPLVELYNQHHLRWNGGSYDQDMIDHFYKQRDQQNYHAKTVASAIEIGRPVNLPKALRALDAMDGVVREIDDPTILEHKALVGRYGFGCEPASAASVAGTRQLMNEGVIAQDEKVVCILTGHMLKDPDATVKYHTGIDIKAVQDSAPREKPLGRQSNPPVKVPDDLEAIIAAL